MKLYKHFLEGEMCELFLEKAWKSGIQFLCVGFVFLLTYVMCKRLSDEKNASAYHLLNLF